MTVADLINKLEQLPQNYEVVIYPKYSSDKVDGYKKHRFRADQVCEQEPYASKIKYNPIALEEYFGGCSYESYEVNNHVAILF